MLGLVGLVVITNQQDPKHRGTQLIDIRVALMLAKMAISRQDPRRGSRSKTMRVPLAGILLFLTLVDPASTRL